MFRNVSVRMIKINTRAVLHIMVVFYLVVILWEFYLIYNLPDRPDYRLLPEALTGPISVCRVYIPDHPPIPDLKIYL